MHKSGLWLFCFMLAATSPVLAASDGPPTGQDKIAAQALVDECAIVLCRKTSRTLTLRTTDGNIAQLDTELFPYLDRKGAVILYPGETITLGLPNDGNGPPKLLKVLEPDGPVDLGPPAASDATLSFELHQDAKLGMVLTVINTTSAKLKYDALMFVATPKGIQTARTSTCPVLPPQGTVHSFSGIENWPNPITTLVLSNIRVLAGDAKIACD